MILELVRKEFVQQLNQTSRLNKGGKLLKIGGTLLFCLALMAIIVFAYYSLDNTVSKYSSYGSFDFLIAALFVAMVVSLIFGTIKARKILFSERDHQVLSPLPIEDEEIVYAKFSYVILYQAAINLLVSTPILCTYLALNEFMPPYYAFALVYAIGVALFTGGLSLILSIGFEFIYRLLKLSDLAQFLSACVVVIFLCYAYQIVLNLFLSGLASNDGSGMINADLVASIHSMVSFFQPIHLLLNAVLNGENVLPGVCLFIGAILLTASLGYSLGLAAFKWVNKAQIQIARKSKVNHHDRILSPERALFMKEWDLLFKDSSNTFSYTSLLIMAPFLSYVVISSLDSIIYDNLRYFQVYFSELVNAMNIFLLLLFTGVINSSAALSASREGRSIQIAKYLPVDPVKMVLIKLAIPTALSSLSLFISVAVLFVGDNISLTAAVVGFLSGVILILLTSAYGLYFDMHDKSNPKHQLSWLNSLISVGVPALMFLLAFGLDLLNVPVWLIYAITIILPACLLIPLFINPKKRWTHSFRAMEVN